jgi:hypothetical protein
VTIKVPSAELQAIADMLRNRMYPLTAAGAKAANNADHEAVGLLHQEAASKVEAVAQKLGHSTTLGAAVVLGISTGLVDVVKAFGDLDQKAGK